MDAEVGLTCAICTIEIRPRPRQPGTMPNWHYWPSDMPKMLMYALEHEADAVAQRASEHGQELGMSPEELGAYTGRARARALELWDPHHVTYPTHDEKRAARKTRDAERVELIAHRGPTGLTYRGLF